LLHKTISSGFILVPCLRPGPERADYAAVNGLLILYHFSGKSLFTTNRNVAGQAVRVISAVEVNVSSDRHLRDFLILILVLFVIVRIGWVDGLVVINIDRTTLDNDVGAIGHVSSPLWIGLD
jgi:hypothetical protein